jgi:hypothetical protein
MTSCVRFVQVNCTLTYNYPKHEIMSFPKEPKLETFYSILKPTKCIRVTSKQLRIFYRCVHEACKLNISSQKFDFTDKIVAV